MFKKFFFGFFVFFRICLFFSDLFVFFSIFFWLFLDFCWVLLYFQIFTLSSFPIFTIFSQMWCKRKKIFKFPQIVIGDWRFGRHSVGCATPPPGGILERVTIKCESAAPCPVFFLTSKKYEFLRNKIFSSLKFVDFFSFDM